jgi:hypothetical protein
MTKNSSENSSFIEDCWSSVCSRSNSRRAARLPSCIFPSSDASRIASGEFSKISKYLLKAMCFSSGGWPICKVLYNLISWTNNRNSISNKSNFVVLSPSPFALNQGWRCVFCAAKTHKKHTTITSYWLSIKRTTTKLLEQKSGEGYGNHSVINPGCPGLVSSVFADILSG